MLAVLRYFLVAVDFVDFGWLHGLLLFLFFWVVGRKHHMDVVFCHEEFFFVVFFVGWVFLYVRCFFF